MGGGFWIRYCLGVAQGKNIPHKKDWNLITYRFTLKSQSTFQNHKKMKTIALFLFSFLTSSLLLGQVDLNEGLVAYYPVNGGVFDETAYGNDPNLANALLSQDRFGVLEGALLFDGTSNFVSIPSRPQNNFNFNTPFSIAFWVNIPIAQSNIGTSVNDIFSKWDGNESSPYPYTIRMFNQTHPNNGKIVAGTYETTAPLCNGAYAITSSTTINDGAWHHIIFMRETENDVLQLYIDCQLEGEINDNASCFLDNESSLCLGMRSLDAFTNHFSGQLDEIRIYDRALSFDEICVLVDVEEVPRAKSIDVELFPNPASDKLTIQLKEQFYHQQYLASIFNNLGVLQSKYHIQGKLQVDVSSFPPGLYYCQLYNNEGVLTTRRFEVIR